MVYYDYSEEKVFQNVLKYFTCDELQSKILQIYCKITKVIKESVLLWQHLKILQKEHPEQEGRIHYELLLERIK